jgi:plastocyanin
MATLRTALLAWLLTSSAAPAYASELVIQIKDRHGKPVADAVILATPSDPKNMLRAKTPTDAVDQVDKQFVPYVKPIFVGSKVRFPNSDHIRHQVYSFSPAKKFELPLYGGTEAAPVVFDKPGIVVLGCNIHDWMVGYIYVAETPFFAKTEAQGNATISDLPPGEYSVRVWHPSMELSEEATAQRVMVNAEGAARAEWSLNLRPTFRVPRVSPNSGSGYP